MRRRGPLTPPLSTAATSQGTSRRPRARPPGSGAAGPQQPQRRHAEPGPAIEQSGQHGRMHGGEQELSGGHRRLKAAGILPHWPINHGVTTSLYYRDPDNNRVELQIDNFATPAELDGYFKSRAFAENPVGVTYDPEELCRRYEAGEAMTDLMRIPPLPAGKTPWDMLASH